MKKFSNIIIVVLALICVIEFIMWRQDKSELEKLKTKIKQDEESSIRMLEESTKIAQHLSDSVLAAEARDSVLAAEKAK